MPDKTGAPHDGAALLRRTSVLPQANLGAGRIHCARAFESPQDPIKITTPLDVVIFMEAPPGIEPGMKVLQTSALPLGYGAILERETGLEPATSALARRRSTK